MISTLESRSGASVRPHARCFAGSRSRKGHLQAGNLRIGIHHLQGDTSAVVIAAQLVERSSAFRNVQRRHALSCCRCGELTVDRAAEFEPATHFPGEGDLRPPASGGNRGIGRDRCLGGLDRRCLQGQSGHCQRATDETLQARPSGNVRYTSPMTDSATAWWFADEAGTKQRGVRQPVLHKAEKTRSHWCGRQVFAKISVR